MLTYAASGAVSRNAAEKKLSSLLDFLAAAAGTPDGAQPPPPPGAASPTAPAPPSLLERVYEATLDSLGEANERLAFRTRLRLAGLWLARGQHGRCEAALADLTASCAGADGGDDVRKGTQLLEVYALEIQLRTALRDAKRLKALYRAALGVRSAIPHPRVMGVIRECGGKAHMHDRHWEAAATDFFEAFKSYDEVRRGWGGRGGAGGGSRPRCPAAAWGAPARLQPARRSPAPAPLPTPAGRRAEASGVPQVPGPGHPAHAVGGGPV